MSATQQAGQVVAGRYRLERALARGGMGSVWIARHLQLDIDVAVKFMTAEAAASANARLRFEREAKAAAKLKSAHIVQIMDYGVEDDTLHIVMELLSGEDLATRLHRFGRLPVAAVAAILGQACEGIALAHDAGIVHRDLKPANLFLCREGRNEIVKVLDFGIAKSPVGAGSSDSTRTGSLIGSPNYMSPEQIVDSKAVDWRTDIWALGVIAFQCMTGREPFPGVEVGAILVGVCHGPIPIPSQLAPDLGPHVDRFFQTALARPPEQRFQHVLEFAHALHVLGQGEGSTSSVPPRLSTVPKAPVLDAAPSQASSLPPPVATPPSGVRSGERATGLTGSVSQAPTELKPAGIRKSPAGLILGVAAVAPVVGGLFVIRPILRPRPVPHDPPVAASGPTSASAVVAVADSMATTVTPAPEPDSGSATPTSAAAAPAERPRDKPKPPSRSNPATANAAAARRAVDCSVPFTVDARGHHIPKPECM